MARLTAGCIGWFGLGVILAEILNTSDLLDVRLKIFFVAAPLALLYVLSQLMLIYFERRVSCSMVDKDRYQRLKTVYLVCFWMVGVCFLIALPFLWWGVIKELAVAAGQGGKAF